MTNQLCIAADFIVLVVYRSIGNPCIGRYIYCTKPKLCFRHQDKARGNKACKHLLKLLFSEADEEIGIFRGVGFWIGIL